MTSYTDRSIRIVITELTISRAEAFPGPTEGSDLDGPMIGFTASADERVLILSGLRRATMICNSHHIVLTLYPNNTKGL
jgi:hypothetical protein